MSLRRVIELARQLRLVEDSPQQTPERACSLGSVVVAGESPGLQESFELVAPSVPQLVADRFGVIVVVQHLDVDQPRVRRALLKHLQVPIDDQDQRIVRFHGTQSGEDLLGDRVAQRGKHASLLK